jgi:endonuclease YncB( thermonuclease family)
MMLKNKIALSIVLYFALAIPLQSALPRKTTTITLDGETTEVYFNDGDTFKVLDGIHDGRRVRVSGFNALESYGPVHEWLNNTPEKLYKISLLATDEARLGGWNCTLEDDVDAYGRLLASCDDLALVLLEKGLAHAYSITSKKAKKTYLAKQKIAQKEGRGMWAGGIPEHIITSIHSVSDGEKHTYNRLISTKDGSTLKMKHQEDYETCQKVCIEDGNSCMIFVPFNERYGKNKSTCLYLDSDAQNGGKNGSSNGAAEKGRAKEALPISRR